MERVGCATPSRNFKTMQTDSDRTPAAQTSEPGWLAILLATLGANLFLFFGSAFFGALAILVSWIPPRGDWTYRVSRMWSRGLLLASGVRVRVLEPPPASATDRPSVVMANHQSLLDIPVLIVTMPGQGRFMAKRALFHIPVFGWALAAGGFIPVDRTDRRRAGETFSAAADRLRRGASVFVFPEETRSRDGRLLPFRRGGFLLAIKTGAPIVPAGIRGTFELRRPGSLWARPGLVEVRYGDAIEAKGQGVSSKRELVPRVEAAVAELAGQPLPSSKG